ncbi:NADPH oxidase 4 [Cyanidiococcus yangmingshanensis]|uniref:NADPH oxidase 4 n=1 Tax=Cyanidiococcus yangmingshanensis TaxID=2690220 RepID=A0A7J7ICQ0_9RHOD|nr:NADPH oxidase 4 [Cyanidiococcus yangmingshanensis]
MMKDVKSYRSDVWRHLQLWNLLLAENGLWYSLVYLFMCAMSWFLAYGVRFVIVNLHAQGTLRYAGSVARGMGFACTFCSLVLPLTINRTLATILYRTPLYDVLCTDRWIPDFHEIVAVSLAATGWIHGIAQIVDYSTRTFKFEGGLFTNGLQPPTTMLFVTGIVLTVLLILITLLAFEKVRRRCFLLFWWTHRPLAVFIYVCLIFHGLRLGRPWTVYFFAGPVALYILDRVYHLSRANLTPRRILALQLTRENSNIVQLSVERLNASYVPGQYFKINIVSAGTKCVAPVHPWHPFTAASSPSCDLDRITFYIAAVGHWTKWLHSVAASNGDGSLLGANGGHRDAMDSLRVLLAGPYGAPAQSHRHFPHQLLIGCGVGATPMVSILREICCCRSKLSLSESSEAQHGEPVIAPTDQRSREDDLSTQRSLALLRDQLKQSGSLTSSKSQRIGILQQQSLADRMGALVLSNLWLFGLLWFFYSALTVFLIANAFDANVALICDMVSSFVLLFLFSLTIVSDVMVTLNPPRWRYILTARGCASMLVCGLLIVDLVIGAALFGLESGSQNYVDGSRNALRVIALVIFILKTIVFASVMRVYFLPRSWRMQIMKVVRQASKRGFALPKQVISKLNRKRFWSALDFGENEHESDFAENMYGDVYSLTFVWVVKSYSDLWGIEAIHDLARNWTRDRIPRLRIHIFITRGEIPEFALEEGNSASLFDPSKSVVTYHKERPDFERFIEDLIDLKDPNEFERLFRSVASAAEFNRSRGFSNDVQRGIFFCGNPTVGTSIQYALRAVQKRRQRSSASKLVFFIKENF